MSSFCRTFSYLGLKVYQYEEIVEKWIGNWYIRNWSIIRTVLKHCCTFSISEEIYIRCFIRNRTWTQQKIFSSSNTFDSHNRSTYFTWKTIFLEAAREITVQHKQNHCNINTHTHTHTHYTIAQVIQNESTLAVETFFGNRRAGFLMVSFFLWLRWIAMACDLAMLPGDFRLLNDVCKLACLFFYMPHSCDRAMKAKLCAAVARCIRLQSSCKGVCVVVVAMVALDVHKQVHGCEHISCRLTGGSDLGVGSGALSSMRRCCLQNSSAYWTHFLTHS